MSRLSYLWMEHSGSIDSPPYRCAPLLVSVFAPPLPVATLAHPTVQRGGGERGHPSSLVPRSPPLHSRTCGASLRSCPGGARASLTRGQDPDAPTGGDPPRDPLRASRSVQRCPHRGEKLRFSFIPLAERATPARHKDDDDDDDDAQNKTYLNIKTHEFVWL